MEQTGSLWKENLGRKRFSPPRSLGLGAVLLGAAAFGTLVPAACQAQADIIPGRSVWTMRLGMSPQALRHSAANPPDDTWHVKGGITAEEWDPDTTVFVQHGRVVQIDISNSNESTPDGISCDSSFAAVRAHYKDLRHTWKWADYQYGGKVDGQDDLYDDPSRGIAFVVFTPKDRKARVEITSISVHYPGHPVITLVDKPIPP